MLRLIIIIVVKNAACKLSMWGVHIDTENYRPKLRNSRRSPTTRYEAALTFVGLER